MFWRLANRYAAWVDAHRVGIVVLSVLLAVLGGYLTSRMPLKSDLSSLLPESRESVKDLKALQGRANAFGKVFIMVEANDEAVRARAAERVRAGVAAIDQFGSDLVGYLSVDDGPAYRHVWKHRFLYADLSDLLRAREALNRRIERARAEANPLYVTIDDEAAKREAAVAENQLASLRAKLADAEQQAMKPEPAVSADRRIQLITIHTTFASSDQKRSQALLGAVHRILDEIRADTPAVSFGVTGTVTMSLAEHDSIVEGMVAAGLITLGLVGLAVLLYFRSRRLVATIVWSLAVGVLATLGLTWLLIGHLNIMSAFLTAIVIGNGINASLIVMSRYIEELHAGREPLDAIGPALGGALPGTVVAILTAAVAYASLVVSDFRGFRHFGVIASMGMLVTWLAAYTVLPAILAILARRGRLRPGHTPGIGKLLRHVMPRRAGWLLVSAVAITTLGGAVAVEYIASDPFTNDWRELTSSNAEIKALRALDAKLGDAIPGTTRFSGLSYQLVIGVEHRNEVAPLVEKLRALDRDRPPADKLLLDVRSIDDMLPPNQSQKLEVLGELRTLIDSKLIDELAPDERAAIRKLRPPENLRELTDADLPRELIWPYIERDGTRGRLIAVRGSTRFKTYDMNDRQAFAAEIRKLELPANAVIGGEPLVIADIVDTMERDTPIMILVALIGSLLVVIAVLGLSRHALVTALSGFSGVAVMVAGCALAGLSVHFLDVIALPITIGVGIDYAANLAARDREPGSTHDHLAATAGAVLLCSYTTTVGYGSLMLSANGGIRSFGLAAIIGELACIFTAMILAPALLMALRERRARRQSASGVN